jgi:hypothetical protein
MNKTEEIFKTITPKSNKQKLIFREAIIKLVQDKLQRDKRFMVKGNEKMFIENYKQRKNDGFSKDRDMRLVALIPEEMVFIAKKMYGDDVLRDKQKFREAFVKNEEGRYCLTVDPRTI